MSEIGFLKTTRCGEDNFMIRNKVAHGIMATYGRMPHGSIPN
jgi:hypothetical protein